MILTESQPMTLFFSYIMVPAIIGFFSDFSSFFFFDTFFCQDFRNKLNILSFVIY